MSILIQFLVKLTISLAVVWLFYHFILRKLTFYNSNRWYLLCYSILAFLIPFVNISPVLENKTSGVIQFVPSVHQYTIDLEEASNCPAPIWSGYDKWDLIAFGLIIVSGILFLRFAISFFSFLTIQRKAKLISNDGVKIYQVDENIIPFSFGRSIYINSRLHTEAELQDIVTHEFVHVKQNHTIDIIWAEILCILNWYNPFAWLLKRSIRQNLEFIADNKVIQNGINKKEYQYLLLKVIGNHQFSIATQFNFSSLKKRIAMMNRSKSAKRQLGRFLFLVPVLAIILLSFRQSFKQPTGKRTAQTIFADTIPDITILNSKGYYIDIKDDKGNCTVVVKDKNKKEVKRLLLTEWNAKAGYYEDLYGEILSLKSGAAMERSKAIREAIITRNPDITGVEVKGNIATITLQNGKTESYTLSINEQKKAFEERCGVSKVAEWEATDAVNMVTEAAVVSPVIAVNAEISDKKTKINLRNSKEEITDEAYSVVTVAENTEPVVSTTIAVQPVKALTVIADEYPATVVEAEHLFTITAKTTAEELETFKKKLKEKGFELTYDEIEFKDGSLVKISGFVKSKDAQVKFVGVDFNKIIISQVKKGDIIYFKIDEVAKKRGVS
jgi:beta-lactamase regulating signal transducer with metallopeptidase domain